MIQGQQSELLGEKSSHYKVRIQVLVSGEQSDFYLLLAIVSLFLEQ